MKSRISGTKKCTIRNFSFIIYKTIKYIFRPIQPQKSNVNCKKKISNVCQKNYFTQALLCLVNEFNEFK